MFACSLQRNAVSFAEIIFPICDFLGMFACSLQRNSVQLAAMIFVKKWFSWENCLLTADRLCSICRKIFPNMWVSWDVCLLVAKNCCFICRNNLSQYVIFLGCLLVHCKEIMFNLQQWSLSRHDFLGIIVCSLQINYVPFAEIIFLEMRCSWDVCLLVAEKCPFHLQNYFFPLCDFLGMFACSLQKNLFNLQQ